MTDEEEYMSLIGIQYQTAAAVREPTPFKTMNVGAGDGQTVVVNTAWYQARIAALEAENKRLVDFANQVVDVAFDGGNLDGCEIQEMAESCGIIETTMATEENRDMWEHIDYMEVGEDFYVKSGPLRRAKAALEGK
jgi:hypothetical protein